MFLFLVSIDYYLKVNENNINYYEKVHCRNDWNDGARSYGMW